MRMSTSRAQGPALALLILCAPEDAPAMRALARRLHTDGFNPSLASDLPAERRDTPWALREALRAADAVVVCLSQRAWPASGPVPTMAKYLELLAVTPAGGRLILTLKLASVETPPALRASPVLNLFSASGYAQLLHTLRAHAAAQPPPPPSPPPSRPPAALPVLSLRGDFGLPALVRQGLMLRLGRGVARMVFLPDADHALVVSGGGPSLVDLRRGMPLWAIDCPTRCAALSPSGRLLAVAAGPQIALWDLADGRLRGSCSGHSAAVTGLAFAPDERTLASASLDRSVWLWRCGGEGASPVVLASLRDGDEQLLSVAFSPDGALIAAGGADRTVRVWRSVDRTRVQTLPGHGGSVEALAFSPDGALLAAGSRGRSVHLWDTRTWRLARSLDGHQGAVESLAFSPDGALLASGAADHQTRIWRSADAVLLHTLDGHAGPVVGVAFSPDGARLATVAEDERLFTWRVADGARLTALRPLSGRVTALAVSPAGERLAVGGSDGSLSVYALEAGGARRTRLRDHPGAVTGLAFAGSLQLITAASDQRIRACHVASGEVSVLMQTHEGQQVAALAPDGRLMASSDGSGTVQLWHLAAPPEVPGGRFWCVLRGLRGRPRHVTFGGDAVAVATDDGRIYAWRLADLEREQREPALALHFADGPLRSLHFSADGAMLAAGGEHGAIQVWRVADGTEQRAPGGATQPLVSLAFAPDARALAAGDASGAIRIWRLIPDEQRRRANPATTITGHAGAVTRLVYTPDGATLISAGSDGTVRLWRT